VLAAKVGTPGFLAELGQCGRWNARIDQIQNRCFGMSFVSLGSSGCGSTSLTFGVFWRKCWSLLQCELSCWYPASGARRLSQKKAKKLGEIRDFFGEVKSELFS